MAVKSKSVCIAEHNSWLNTYVVASCMSCYSILAGVWVISLHDVYYMRDTYLYEKENLIVQQFFVT